jgi:hypothetical protein
MDALYSFFDLVQHLLLVVRYSCCGTFWIERFDFVIENVLSATKEANQIVNCQFPNLSLWSLFKFGKSLSCIHFVWRISTGVPSPTLTGPERMWWNEEHQLQMRLSLCIWAVYQLAGLGYLFVDNFPISFCLDSPFSRSYQFGGTVDRKKNRAPSSTHNPTWNLWLPVLSLVRLVLFLLRPK